MNPIHPPPRTRLFLLLLGMALACRIPAGAADGMPKVTPSGFAVPQPDPVLVFPRDHGSHPEFQLEWWYVTGHLEAAGGREFGFQATFFRRAGERPGDEVPGALFGPAPVYLAHMALTDVAGRTFRFQERVNRGGWDARASAETLDVANGNWSLRRSDGGSDRFRLVGGIRAEAAFDLALEPVKPLVVFGERGVSRKASDPTAASHYLTFPRMRATGSLRIGAENLEVTGGAWMDHEFSSSQLGADQVGWDWASLQLADGREVMVYRMRRADGATDPHSTIAWIGKDGTVRQSGPDTFRWEEGETWRSPRTGGRYPIRPLIRATDPAGGRPVEFRLEPVLDAQELDGALGGVPYWEGACRVRDGSGREVGRAYLELTGYVRPVTGQVR